jgi:hypothetical protein
MSLPMPSAADQPSVSRNRLILVVYTAAIFTSALLLFSVQPLFTKMVLPRLGGSPAVWSVAMVFFQSLLLGGYPVLLEPMFTLRTQNLIWTGLYGLLILLIAGCGVLLLRSPANVVIEQSDDADVPAPSWTLRLRWIFLAAVPSGLLIAVTAHISTDVAAAPLLWVLPLSLYLLTWVLVFQSRPLFPHQWVLMLQPLAIAGVIVLLAVGGERSLLMTLGGHLLCFFIIAMACHGELAHTRPASKYLTGFYVALSFGGMVGGLFAGLIAPFTFSWIAEYPILVALAVLCRPPADERWSRWSRWYWPLLAVVAVALIAPVYSGGKVFAWLEAQRVYVISAIAIAGMILAILLKADRAKLAGIAILALVLIRAYPSDDGRVETVRSFFGVHKIVVTPNGQYHVLMHGTTIHGAEKFKNDDGTPVTGRPEVISYYHKDGGMGQAIAAIRERKGGPLRVAVIGLGSGTLTCASQPGENWKFFEIDQSMVDTARDPKYFTFIQKCEPDLQPVIGDARLTFAKELDGIYDLIIVDAYSSDAIPIHLATEEAMEIYKRKLAPQGAVVMHVSNRHLELSSVVVGIADANDLKSWVYSEDSGRDNEYIFSTTVVVSAREEADVGALASSDKWALTEAEDNQRVWTDDYSNVLGAVWRRLRDGEQ